MPHSSTTVDITTAAALPLQSGPGDDHPDTTGDNTAILIGGPAQAGVIGVAGDIDRFRVELSAGTSYRFELASGSKGVGYSELVLLSGSGSKIAKDAGGGGKEGDAQISYTAAASGTYYLDAMGRNGSTGNYSVHAIQTSTTPVTPQPDPVTNDDYPAANSTTGVVVPNGAAVQGVLERAGDVDYFKVTLEANAAYTFSLQGRNGGLEDTVLRLHAEDGRTLASDDDGSGTKNGGSRISFTAPASGTYYLDVSSDVSQSGGQTSTPVTPQPDPVPIDDYPAANNTTGLVVPNGAAAEGVLERVGDVDYFKVTLEANAAYTFSLQGRSGGLQDTVLRLHAEDGRLLASDDDGSGTKNGGSRISFTAPASGTYYLDVSSDVSQSGGYSLSAAMDDYPASSATTGLVTVDGEAVRGELESPRDVDWLRVDLRAGVLYQLDIEGAPSNTGGTTLAAPGISLRTADGNTLGNGSKSGVERMSFVAPADGTYYVNVEARDRTSTGTYAVKATTLPDDHPASAATTGVVQVNGGATTGRIDAPTDVDYFKVQLAEGTWYSFALAGTDGAATLVDTYLRLRAADGQELAGNDDVSPGSKNSSSGLRFQAPASGTYYLEASGDGRLVGGYKLSAFTALSIAEATPANGAVDVARAANLVLTLDRPVQSNHGTVTIQGSPEQGGGLQQISLDDASQVSIDGRTITINPASDLAANMEYYVRFSNGAVRDTDGNVLEGPSGLKFTTAANRAPTAADLTVEASPGLPLTGSLPTAVDADGDNVLYLAQELPRGGGRLTIGADGRYTYEAPFWFSGTDQFRFTVMDSQGATNDYTATVNVAALPTVQGTAQPDTLAAASGTHLYAGLDGNDRISTGPGPDVVDGGGGSDTLVLAVPRSAATLQHRGDGGWTIGSPASGTDQVFDVERIQFTDISTTLGITGSAAQVARVIGAVFGTAQLGDAALVGRYLALADSGMGGEQVVHEVLADPLFASLAGSRSNEDVVKHVYTNIVGHAPTSAEVGHYSGLITGGQYTQDSLLWWAASLDETAQRIDLNGLATHGLDFLPVAGS
jgi:hypothetical protein